MVGIDFTHAGTQSTHDDIISAERERILAATTNYTDPRCSVALASDPELFHAAVELAQQYREVDLVVIIGIGGSNLGTLAALSATYGIAWPKHVVFFDTVDPDDTVQQLQTLRTACQDKKRVLINIISKSGTTAETLANAKVVCDLLTEHDYALSETVVITTDKDSALDAFALQHAVPALHIPALVGGRFSVLSPVGVFPLAVLGVDVQELLGGAREALDELRSGQDCAARLASVQYAHALSGRNLVDFFVFAKRFSAVGAWYRQLLAESIGKTPQVGIRPTTSVGSTDLHSVAQLYLAGPADKFFLLVSLSDAHPVLVSPSPLDSVSPAMKGVSHNELYAAIYQGTKQAFIGQDIPFVEFSLAPTAHDLGYLLQLLMLEVIYLGALFEVNPFDQPAVELYKKETRAALTR